MTGNYIAMKLHFLGAIKSEGLRNYYHRAHREHGGHSSPFRA